MLGILIKGRLAMIPLLMCSVLGLAIIIERYRYLKEVAVNTDGLRNRVRDLLRRRDIDGALVFLNQAGGPVSEILRAGVEKLRFMLDLQRPMDVTEPAVEKAMEEQSGHVVTQLEENLPMLMTVLTIAPLLGFLGTVTGMIKSFNTLAEKGMDPKLVGIGIAEALITTATGLIIAIPCFVAYSYFTRRIRVFVDEVETAGAQMMEGIAAGWVSAGIGGAGRAAEPDA